MRIPYSKVYRAFPELDAFSDGECEEFVQLASRERAAGLLATAMAAVVASLGVGGALGWWTRQGLGQLFGDPPTSARGDFAWGAYIAAGGTVGLLAGALVGLLIRDRWLRWAIVRRLRTTRCPGCSYSLLGLNVLEGRVRCPECGVTVMLAERGLTPADILAGARGVVMKGGGA